jgi:YD repeat-containing protein
MCRIAALPVALSVLAVRPVSPVTSVRLFLSHRARATKKTAKFAKILDVHLIDGFQDGHFDLTAAGDFFVATTDGAAGGLAGRTHLRAYKLKAVKGSPKHVQQLQVPVSDEVGTLRIVNTTKPELLLVPTTADPLVVPAPPDPVNDPLDHYKCYRVAIAKKTAKLPKGLQATVTDPFTGTDETFAVKALKHLCLPVDEDGAGIRDASRELACYTVAGAKGQPKAVPQHALQLNNQLGPLTIDTAKESELCVPAERPVPTPTPRGSGGLATATRTATPVGAATPTPLSTTVPPDPSLVAPPVARGVVSIPALGTSFLYTGADPVQTGVAAGTIDARRAAVLRGRVLTTAGAPIAGVTIDIQGHPALGTTRTQLDGGFDLVANGGGPLTVRYRKDGLLAVTRELDVPWQQFVMVPDVVMMALDAAVTAVTFGPNAPFQTAASTTQNDGDGTRHTLLLFPAGTSALLVLADGSTQSAGTLHIRATEFTVGASGPAAMPAALPPLSGYTYCTELSADEAIAAGATTVAFDQPVIAYTENFLDFPVGAAVPLGFFDRRRAVWVAEPNGRIVKITAVNGGVAAVDTDGDGVADDGLALTLAERQSLGAAYPAGTSLWRMPTEHFSPHDGNNPFDTTGDTPPGENGAGPDADDTTQDSCQSGGSIIECENQVLGEKVAIVGTPYTLDYRSDRVPARSASKHIRLSGAAVPPTLASIDLHLAVAGRSFDQSFPASPNQETTFTWDRMDAYGRQLIGGQTLAVTIDYNYPAVYREPGPFPEAFNQTGGTTFGANPTRQQVNLSDHFTTTIGEGLTDARTIGLGGWSLGVHHVYDPVARVLYTGGGSRQRAGSLARLLATIDLPGKSVLFDVATGPDGSLYVALPHHDEIMRIAPDGTETVVAGTGTEGFSGDGGLATAAELGDPTGVAVAADGSLYIAEQGNRRVRRVGVDGIITTIAGSNTIGTSGDGGPATLASFTTAERIAVGADASLYVVDGGTRIRRITTDGIIRTVGGNGVVGFGGDGGPATSAKLNCASVSAAADGGFYIADIFNHRVRRVAPDGTIATIVDYTADQGTPASVRPAPDGGLVIAVSFTSARTPVVDLRKTDGTLLTIAGGGPTPVKDGVPATQANLAAILAVALGPDGSVYLVRGGNDSHVVRVSAALPGFEGQQILIASPNGDELYVFDPDGRHRRTLHARTGAVLREFGYDASGRLASITEKTGGTDNVTTIEHDAAGNPSAIVGPFGQRTELTVDANGFLATIANPAAETQQLTSSADGLLLTLTSARGKTSTYTYDDDGRLLVDADPATGTQTLARTAGADAFTVTRTTTLGRVTSHTVATLAGDVQQRTVTDPAGVERTSRETIDAGTSHLKASDGTTFDGMLGPDPRFGMQASFAASERLHFPSGLESHVTRTRRGARESREPPEPPEPDRHQRRVREDEHHGLHRREPGDRDDEPARPAVHPRPRRARTHHDHHRPRRGNLDDDLRRARPGRVRRGWRRSGRAHDDLRVRRGGLPAHPHRPARADRHLRVRRGRTRDAEDAGRRPRGGLRLRCGRQPHERDATGPPADRPRLRRPKRADVGDAGERRGLRPDDLHARRRPRAHQHRPSGQPGGHPRLRRRGPARVPHAQDRGHDQRRDHVRLRPDERRARHDHGLGRHRGRLHL